MSVSWEFAFLGVRSCELHAIAIQDKVFMGYLSPRHRYTDPTYQLRRSNVFIVAVNCGQAGGTCFCTSMQTGPKATAGFDLALTEVLDANPHSFVVEVGTELGAEILRDIPHREARSDDIQVAEQIVANTAAHMGRSMETTGIKDLLYRNLEHPRWNDVATRCLTCGNCTMVCPTCFCTTVEDVTDLAGERAERWRKWDSCYTMDFSYIYGGSIRSSTKARYRLSDEGLILDAKIVPPTSQNQKTIENDLQHYVEQAINLPEEQLTWQCEQAIRNYNPCISCATHFLKLHIERS